MVNLLGLSAVCIASLNVLSTLGLLTTNSKPTRTILCAALFGLTGGFQYGFTTWYQNRMHRGLAASILWAYLLSAVELLLISDVNLKDAPNPKSNNALSGKNIKWAFFLVWNFRRIGTKWQVRNVPSFGTSASDGKPPSQGEFVRKRLLIVVIASLFLDGMTAGPPPDMEMFSEHKQYLTLSQLSQFDAEEVITRVILTMTIALNAALPILITYYATSIILVITGLSLPAEFPQLYGAILKCYSVRRFWGNLWHQWLRWGLTAIATSINSSLAIPRTSNLYRVSMLLSVFFISGCIHQLSDLAIGIPQSESNGFYFFMMQPLAIIFEDTFESVYFRPCAHLVLAARETYRSRSGFIFVG
ncbi:hypothetical protein PISL3812_03361 [Talaromyces islandicus]|uniref:Wax synthase domain-containing protein n=1 Tax=Talaromyces islandicus TaxID=28573 RepID=A0A0U1LUA2_TALIS|nr:hypothetical protein PISL3812_03361 [Talaromyces islandicus]